jgi:hypothetical protein
MEQAMGGGQQQGKGKGQGRKPTGANSPALEQKSDGRSTVRESKR